MGATARVGPTTDAVNLPLISPLLFSGLFPRALLLIFSSLGGEGE